MAGKEQSKAPEYFLEAMKRGVVVYLPQVNIENLIILYFTGLGRWRVEADPSPVAR